MRNAKSFTFFCIGTDRSTGDALGPLVGTALKKKHPTWNVIGTLENPVHAQNIQERFKEIKEGTKVIAIDACLGQFSSVGEVRFCAGPLKPGAGVQRELGEFGDYHYKGIVAVGGFMEYFVLQNTSLHKVMTMADEIVKRIESGVDLVGLIPQKRKYTKAVNKSAEPLVAAAKEE